MESYVITSLPPLSHPSPPRLTEKLPEFRPLFFVPPLEDRPQNPIVEALVDPSSLPQLVAREEDCLPTRGDAEPQQKGAVDDEADILTEAIVGTHAPKVLFSACSLQTMVILFC